MRAAPSALRNGDWERLESWLRSSTIQAGLAQRARIVLLAADGLTNVDIAGRVGVSLPTATSWRTRYGRSGIGRLCDEARSGRPRTIDQSEPLTLLRHVDSVGQSPSRCRVEGRYTAKARGEGVRRATGPSALVTVRVRHTK